MTDNDHSGTRANGTGDVPVLSRARSAVGEQIATAAPSVSAEQVEVDRACAWADYRKEYGARGVVEHKAFCAGWDAARGRLDVGGVQR